MSLIEDSLLADKLDAVKQAQNALNDEKNNYYIVLGEWLENALQSDNKDIKDFFVREAENTKFLKRKHDRVIAKKVADKLQAISKVKTSDSSKSLEHKNSDDILTNSGQQNASLI